MRTIKAFCGWGEASDVGINIYQDDKVISGIDLDAKKAEALIYELQRSITEAKELEAISQFHDNMLMEK